jgi:hypothetical protein
MEERESSSLIGKWKFSCSQPIGAPNSDSACRLVLDFHADSEIGAPVHSLATSWRNTQDKCRKLKRMRRSAETPLRSHFTVFTSGASP